MKQFKKLEADYKANQLKVSSSVIEEVVQNAVTFQRTGEKPSLDPYWTLSRDNVIAYANLLGQTPSFLYKEHRIHDN